MEKVRIASYAGERCDGWCGQCANAYLYRVVTVGRSVRLLCIVCTDQMQADNCVKSFQMVGTP